MLSFSASKSLQTQALMLMFYVVFGWFVVACVLYCTAGDAAVLPVGPVEGRHDNGATQASVPGRPGGAAAVILCAAAGRPQTREYY